MQRYGHGEQRVEPARDQAQARDRRAVLVDDVGDALDARRALGVGLVSEQEQRRGLSGSIRDPKSSGTSRTSSPRCAATSLRAAAWSSRRS